MSQHEFIPSQTAVLIVDLQNDFLHPEGAYGRSGTSSLAIAALPEKIGPLLDVVRSAGGWIVSTQFTLVPGKQGYLGGLIELELNHYLSPERLLEVMRTGKPGVYDADDGDMWGVHQDDPEQARAFTAGMHSISELPAQALASALDLSSHTNVLDIGGGSGVFVIAFLERWPNMRGTVLELAPVCSLARERFVEANLIERASTHSGDMFKDEYPLGFDIVLFSQIMHDWSLDTNRGLLLKANSALPVGGKVIIHEKLLNPERSGPLANALVSLDMLYWTEGRQYTAAELHQLLVETGFSKVQVVPTEGYWSAVVAEKS